MNDQPSTEDHRLRHRILVVDDDQDLADTLARLLSLEGYDVRQTYSIAGARRELDKFRASVALIDIRMGDGSGLDLVAEIRRLRPDTTCVMMTAYSSADTAIKALQAGAYDYLCKPFYTEDLLATLKRCIERITLTQGREQAEAALRLRNRELVEINTRLHDSVNSMRALATYATVRELCAAVLEEIVNTMGAERGVIYLKEGDRLLVKQNVGADAAPATCQPAEADSLFQSVLNERRPVVVNLTDRDSDASSIFRPGSKSGPVLAFPLIGEAREPAGVVAVQAGQDRLFSQQDREFGEILVSFAGEAIRLVRVFESLASSEERLRQIIDNSPSLIALKDLEGRFVVVNKRFEEWYGHKQANVVGRTSRDLFPEDIARLYTDQYEEALNNRTVVDQAFEIPFADGKHHSVLVTKFPVLGANGQTKGVGTIATDVTDSRRAEEQLRQAQKMEALGHLTGGIAHDFNNLLAVISGNLELMKDEIVDGSDMGAIADDALSAAHSSAELTQRLLAFGRRQTLHPQPIDAGELVKGMSRLLVSTLGETIETIMILNEALWLAEIDRNQLESSLLNLAINARDAMSDGGVLTIETANVTIDGGNTGRDDTVVPGQYIMVSVTDTGTGMSPEIVEAAMQPFFTTKQEGHGSGLGLSMVYGFVKQSGGHLEISSKLGEGTTVKFYLPKARQGALEIQTQARISPEISYPGERILVVDDKAGVRRLAKRILTRLGYEVLEAADGKTALESLDCDPNVDLLFTDLVLPGKLNGVDLAKQAQARYPGLKVLYTTGYADSAVLKNDPSCGDIAFIKKPYAKESLARMVRHALKGAPHGAASVGPGSAWP